jgi:uncharacterized protein with GYD domain
MLLYILLSTLTPEGRKRIKKNAERIKEVNKEIGDFSAKVIANMLFWARTTSLTLSKLPTTKRLRMSL